MWQRSTAGTAISRGVVPSRRPRPAVSGGPGRPEPEHGAAAAAPVRGAAARRVTGPRRSALVLGADRPGHRVDRGGCQVMPRTVHGGAAAADHRLGVRQALARRCPAGAIFPASVSYPPPSALDDDPSLTLSARPDRHRQPGQLRGGRRPRRGRRARPRRLHDHAAGHLRRRDGQLRGDRGRRRAAGVGPGGGRGAARPRRRRPAASGPPCATVPFGEHPAAGVHRHAAAAVRRPLRRAPYVVLYTVGYADSRPSEPVTGDSYADAEMTSAGRGRGAGGRCPCSPRRCRRRTARGRPDAERPAIGAASWRVALGPCRGAGAGERRAAAALGLLPALPAPRPRPTRSATSSSGCSTC